MPFLKRLIHTQFDSYKAGLARDKQARPILNAIHKLLLIPAPTHTASSVHAGSSICEP